MLYHSKKNYITFNGATLFLAISKSTWTALLMLISLGYLAISGPHVFCHNLVAWNSCGCLGCLVCIRAVSPRISWSHLESWRYGNRWLKPKAPIGFSWPCWAPHYTSAGFWLSKKHSINEFTVHITVTCLREWLHIWSDDFSDRDKFQVMVIVHIICSDISWLIPKIICAYFHKNWTGGGAVEFVLKTPNHYY